MPTPTIDELKKKATALHETIYGLDKAHAVLEIVSAFIQIIEHTHRDVMDSVETTLLRKDR